MKRLIILGAGRCGREVLQWAKDVNRKDPRWDAFAFLDFDRHCLDGKKCDARIIGTDDDYVPTEEDEFVCAVGSGALREKITNRIEASGGKFVSVIHPTAVIADSAEIGIGTIIYPYTILTADVTIGKGCLINMKCSIAHDVVMGNFCTISPDCDLTGECTLGERAFLGVGANLIPRVRVGDDAYICAGSTVMTHVKAGYKMLGCPAKKVEW